MKTLVIAEHNGENLSAATLSVIDAAKKPVSYTHLTLPTSDLV